MITPKEYYSSRMDSLAARIAIHRRRNRLFVGGEIASFALFIAFIFAYAQLEWGSMGVWAAVLSIIIYVVIRRMDEQNEARTEWLEALREVCSRELAYLVSVAMPLTFLRIALIGAPSSVLWALPKR